MSNNQGHNVVANIIMNRGGYSYGEAIRMVEECEELMLEALDFGDDPCEILMDLLGLEPDYVMDVMSL